MQSGMGSELSIDIIDYVTGIGNMRAICVALKSVKIYKKMANNDALPASSTWNNIIIAAALVAFEALQ